MTTLTLNFQTHHVSTTTTVSAQGTVQFLGAEWCCLGAQPGWEVTLETASNFGAWQAIAHPVTHDAITANHPEVVWHCTLVQDFNRYDTPAEIAERLPEGFVDSLFDSTVSEVEGYAFRLNPNNTL